MLNGRTLGVSISSSPSFASWELASSSGRSCLGRTVLPPGPLLEPKEHPKLFEALAGIAEATKQQMPAEVYLTAEVNAWVMDRGGIMGRGRRRIMGLGLPLLQVLSVCQLRAVLAHEFGHFHGGDTKLGPWIYKTRAAIGRTLQGLTAYSSFLQTPFLWYGKAFLHMTHAVPDAKNSPPMPLQHPLSALVL